MSVPVGKASPEPNQNSLAVLALNVETLVRRPARIFV